MAGDAVSGEAGARGIAFLGCGGAAEMHADTLSSVAPDRPRFFASRDGDRARRFAAEHGGDAGFGDYRAALHDERVGVALILTPPAHHLEWTLEALEAGNHVIVEKPAFLTGADFDQVEEAVRTYDRRVLVAENYHYKPLARSLRRLLAENEVGDLLFLRVDAVKAQDAGGWRDDPDLAGGGALMEGGIHWVSLLAHLGPRVRRVEAVRPRAGDGEKSMALLMEYEEGGAASLTYSWEVPSPLKGLRLSHLHGTEGSATFESNGLFVALRGRSWALRFPGFRDIRGYRAMFRDLLGALDQGRPADFRLRDAREDVALVHEAYRKAGMDPPTGTTGAAASTDRNREQGETQ